MIKNNGIKILFNEFANNLPILNQFKTKQLKQFYETNDLELVDTYNDAVETKNIYSQLLNELNYLDSFLSLPIIDYLNNENIEDLTNLIQSAFISIGYVCISENIISNITPTHQSKVGDGSSETIETILVLTCVSWKYFNFFTLAIILLY